MAFWADKGHAMRRRDGDPSNHHEAAGNSMARSHETHEEAYESAASAGSVRVPIGAAVTYTGSQGTPVAKKNTQSADPTAGGKANRTNIEKIGATYRVQPKTGSTLVDPSVGPTMANARVVPSVAGRANPNFEAGIQSSNA